MATSSWLLSLLVAGAAALPSGAEPPEAGLERARGQAMESVDEAHEARVRRHRDLERLRKDLRYISEELDREVVAEGDKDLAAYSKGGLERLAGLRQRGGIDPKLGPTLAKLDAIYRGLPDRTYAEQYPGSLVRFVSEELRWAAQTARSEAELLRMLDEGLALPDRMDGEDPPPDAPRASAFFPIDVPLSKFKRLGPIRIFLMKHRIARPKTHSRTTAEAIVAGKHNVQVGVEIEGLVRRHYLVADLDYCFDIGDLHIEMTPEWRLLHPGTPKPRAGQRVRVRGWTYYDVFHKAELEYDPGDKDLGSARKTLWEIHPVQDVEILP